MENVDLQFNIFDNVKTTESALYLTYCSQTKGWILQVEAKPWKQLQEEREALMTREIEKTKVSDTIRQYHIMS